MRHYKILSPFFLAALFFCGGVNGQELTIGDTLPDYTFDNVLRYPSSSLNLHDFRGKVLILDLWRTTCTHAITSFTHFDSLRKTFPGQVEALGITTEDREPILQYLADDVVAQKTDMPVITNDTLLAKKRFPFIYIPHVVVADTYGRIVAIANPEQVTADFIRGLLSGHAVRLPLKKEITDFNFGVPVLAEGNGRNVDSLAYTSTVMHRLPGVQSADSYDTSGGRLVYQAYNVSIPELYARAYHQLFDKNKVVLYVKDSSRFTNANYDDINWQNQNLWCYNLILPPRYPHPESFVIGDLNRFFATKGTLEWRNVPCLVIQKKGKGKRWKMTDSTGGYYDITEHGIRTMHHFMLGTLASAFNFESPVLILDGTNDFTLADIQIHTDITDTKTLRKDLWNYDLDLVPVMKKIEVLVIRDK